MAGMQLKASVNVVRSAVSDGIRTVVLSRPLQGAGAVYTFSVNDNDVKFISAVGSGPQFACEYTSHHLHPATQGTFLTADCLPVLIRRP